jgi:hypothetical protein
VLNRRARRVYLRGWYEMTRRGPRAVARERARRELTGGGRYLVQRMLRGQAMPRFEAAAELTDSKGMP